MKRMEDTNPPPLPAGAAPPRLPPLLFDTETIQPAQPTPGLLFFKKLEKP